jgi:hypothetical protein
MLFSCALDAAIAAAVKIPTVMEISSAEVDRSDELKATITGKPS